MTDEQISYRTMKFMLYMEHSAPQVPQTDGLRLQLQGMTLCEAGMETRLKDIPKDLKKKSKKLEEKGMFIELTVVTVS